jgi:hypothetical protein
MPSRSIGEAKIHQPEHRFDSVFFVTGPVAAFNESQDKVRSMH